MVWYVVVEVADGSGFADFDWPEMVKKNIEGRIETELLSQKRTVKLKKSSFRGEGQMPKI